MTKDTLSIILLSWCKAGSDKLRMLDECVRSVKAHTEGPYELIVVDNGSDMAEASELMRENADIYVRLKENTGFGPGMDRGYLNATGGYACFLNDDIIVPPGWDVRLKETARDGHIVCPALFPHGPVLGSYGDRTKAVADFAAGIDTEAMGIGEFGQGAGFGALFLARKEVFDGILEDGHVFDPRFRYAMFEDSDLWMRADRAGVKRLCDNRVWVYHVGNGTVWKLPDFSAVYEENRRLFNDKWKTDR
jgi:glycosyltransferase involved in cell wall biosynthesis